MRLKIDDKEFSVSILPDKKGYIVGVGEKRIRTTHGSPDFCVNRKRYTANVHEKADNAYNVTVNQDNYSVELAESTHSIGKFVKCPMQGVVLAVDVKKGQRVKEGQTLARILSMKMENEVKAETDCTVKGVMIRNKQQVMKGDVLFETGKEDG
jgi:biotin carboxyl carrier protein